MINSCCSKQFTASIKTYCLIPDTCITPGYSGGDRHFGLADNMDPHVCIENCIDDPECDYAVHKERKCMFYKEEQLHKMEDTEATLFAKKCQDTGNISVFIIKQFFPSHNARSLDMTFKSTSKR